MICWFLDELMDKRTLPFIRITCMMRYVVSDGRNNFSYLSTELIQKLRQSSQSIVQSK